MLEKDLALLMRVSPENPMEKGWMSGVLSQRTRTRKAGQLLYCACYPVWDRSTEKQATKKLEGIREQSRTREAQRHLNAKNAQRKLEVLLNENFGPGDLLLSCTYRDDEQPEDDKAAHRDIVNMLKRVKTLYRRHGLPSPRYVYVTEVEEKSRGRCYHHHLVLEGGVDRDALEACWAVRFSGHCNSRIVRYQPEGLTGFARYITKHAQGYTRQQVTTRRRWCASKGLRFPPATIADRKISRRRVERIAEAVEARPSMAREVLEKVYPGYTLLEVEVKTSKWAAGAYMYAVMTKKPTLEDVIRSKAHGRRRSA